MVPDGASSPKLPVEIKCNIEAGSIAQLFLIFSIDNGSSWYEVEMHESPPFYAVTIPNVRVGLRILYAFEAIGGDGVEFIEDNMGQYFSQIAGAEKDQIIKNDTPLNNKSVESVSAQDLDEEEEYSKKQVNDSAESYDRFISSENKPQNSTVSQNKQLLNDEKLSPGIKIPVQLGLQSPKVREIGSPMVFSHNEIDQSKNITEKLIETKETHEKNLTEETQVVAFTPATQQVPELKSVNENNDEISAQYPAPFTNQSGNPDLARPIIPYNPYTIEDGEVTRQVAVLQSFSQIIGAKATKAPQKKQSFIKRPQVENQKRCGHCNANISQKWRICIICGKKV